MYSISAYSFNILISAFALSRLNKTHRDAARYPAKFMGRAVFMI